MDNRIKAVLAVIALIVAAVVFFGTTQEGTGVVDTKWQESNTSCDSKGNCSTSQTYYVQFKDGRLMTFMWGTIDYDKVRTGDTVSFTAHWPEIRPFGIRIMVPSITTLKSVIHSKG